MRQAEQDRFDRLLEEVLDALPPRLHELLERAPLIVEDHPDPRLLRELGVDEDDVLCGLHSGTPITERSMEAGIDFPETIHIFREGVVEVADGWDDGPDEHGRWRTGEQRVKEQIRITLLHEIGHHFGLEEDDLEELGYG